MNPWRDNFAAGAAAGVAGGTGVQVGFIAEEVFIEPGAGFLLSTLIQGATLLASGIILLGEIDADLQTLIVVGKGEVRHLPGGRKPQNC